MFLLHIYLFTYVFIYLVIYEFNCESCRRNITLTECRSTPNMQIILKACDKDEFFKLILGEEVSSI